MRESELEDLVPDREHGN